MAKQNYLLITLRVISIVLLALLLAELGQIYNPEIYNVINIFSIIGILRDIFAFLIYIMLYYIYIGLYSLFGMFLSLIGLPTSFFASAGTNFFYNMIGRWFKFTFINENIASTAPSIENAQQGLIDLVLDATQDLYMVGLQLLVIVMFYYALRGAFISDPGASLKVILYLNGIIIIPMFFMQIVIVLEMFGLSPLDLPVWFQDIVFHDLLYEGIFVDISDLSLWDYLQTDIFLVAVLEFIFLEFVFQLAYVDKVTRPSIEREQRLNHQIEVMHTEAIKAIARIKAIEERKRELKLEARANLTEDEREAQKKERERLSLQSLMSEAGGQTGFSYVADLIRKKKEEKREAKMMNAMRDTRKIANFLDKLFKQDPSARDSLTASSSAPRASRLVFSTILNMFIRILVIIAMAWACVHPYQLFQLIGAPDSILNSVELQIYEGSWSIIIPLVLIIPLISYVIKITKHTKLEEMLRLEEIRRAGVTEEEYDAMIEAREKGLSAEDIQMQRDQDAMDYQAQRASI
ncbi:MAG: hypothetical protein ACTSYI_04050 [Promethearchaeota archaeon]